MLYRPTTILTVIMYFSLLVPMLFLKTGNPDIWTELLALALVYSALQVIRHHLYSINFSSWPNLLMLLIQWGIAFAIQIIDGSFIPQIYFFIILAEAAYKTSVKFSVPFALFCYLGFVYGIYLHYNQPPFEEIHFVIPRILEYGLIFGFSYVTQKANLQKEQLNYAYEKLKRNQQHLEEKTLMEERVRLSREFHDTIGHTLTTALVGMETGKQLMLHHKTDEAIDKLDLARKQVKNSLENVRKSVKTLHKQQSFIHFEKSLKALIEETRTHTGVMIDTTISELPPMNPQQELTLYRALQEGLTNGIKHGKCSTFQFSLNFKDGHIHFLLQDNGTMPLAWQYGFGLSAMQERVKQLKGVMKISRNREGGCQLSITMPLNPTSTQVQPTDRRVLK